MILRKPYAFLIKHFKLMHVILSICIFYLIYCTGSMIGFINGYVENNISVVGQEIVENLYNIGVILLPILIIIFSSILLVVMTLKDKPRLFYILMIIAHIAIFAVYIYGYNVFSSMEETIIDMRTIKALRDLLLYVIIAQTAFSIFSVVRGVGFDIKKFNFSNDLQDLEISAEDNEEFEVALNFDLNDKKRVGKKAIRYVTYWIKEHKLLVGITTSIVVLLSIILVVSDYLANHKSYPEGHNLTMNGFSFKINKSYILNTDAKGNNITGESAFLVVADLSVKCNETKPKSLTLGSIELDVAGDIYHHTDKYAYQLTDLGTVYNNQEIGNESERYLLVFEVPATASKSKMKLGFRNTNIGKTSYISLSLNEINEVKKYKETKLGKTLDFSDSTLGKTTLKINSYEIKNKFTVKYNYCSPRKRCVSSVEYLTPNLFNSSYNKALLKIEAEFTLDEEFSSPDIKDIYGLFKTFATIEYEIDGVTKRQTVYLGSVKSSKVKQENVYYFEVFQEIKIADKITIIFNVRNREYKYSLK